MRPQVRDETMQRVTGIDWMPQVPTSWAIKQLRHVVDVETGNRDTVEASPDGCYPFFVRSPTVERIDSYSYSGEGVLTAGDGDVGKIFHHVIGDYDVHQRVYLFRNFRGMFGRFFYYYMASQFVNVTERGTAKSTVESLRRPMIVNFPVAVPDPSEQRAIADFLNRETDRIDELIAKQNALIELLGERSLANQIHETYQRNDGNVMKLRRAVEKVWRRPTPGSEVVTAYRDGEVTRRSLRRDDGYTFSEQEVGYQGVMVGDLVFHGLDGFAGAVGVANSNGICSPVYHVCAPLHGNVPKFLAYQLRSLGVTGFLMAQAGTVRQRSVDFRNWSNFGQLPVWMPPVEVQTAAVDRIELALARTGALVAKADAAVSLLRERRLALITAAVTGKIDVRGAV